MCPDQTGYTSANYEPGPQHDSDYIIKEVTQLQQLDGHSVTMTVPTRLGIGSSLWQLQHTWQDSPQGLVVNSSQRVGVVQPAWRPLWYAKWRNALVRGMFARGRDPVWLLQQWLHHCVEEVSRCCCLVWLLLRPWTALMPLKISCNIPRRVSLQGWALLLEQLCIAVVAAQQQLLG